MKSGNSVSRVLGVFLVSSLMLLSGCSEKDPNLLDVWPVQGTVSKNGQPIKQGVVTFFPEHPESGVTRTSVSGIRGGEYELSTYDDEDGCVPGKYRVTVHAFDHNNINQAPGIYGEELTTPLRFEVKLGEENRFDIVLEENQETEAQRPTQPMNTNN